MSADPVTRYMTRAMRLGALALLLPLSACEWFSDFKRQPKIDPWESPNLTTPPRGNPQFSVPVTGTAVSGFQVSYAPLPGTVDSMSSLRNPTGPGDASLANGRQYYAINCAVCHGDAGKGDGPAVQYGMVGINLLGDLTKNRTDGYLFGMMRNGRGLMPTYNRIEEMDRWDVVNYVRGLQGLLAAPVPLGAVGRPGETGALVPGATRTGPTRPAPFRHPGDGAPPPTAGHDASPVAHDSAATAEGATP